tara:strand:+ start:196 stop:582 length:387 start_codon:yes stop_codon:yes gene_type:complete
MFVYTTSVYVEVNGYYTLLIRRSATDPSKPKFWEVPGGHIDILLEDESDLLIRQEALRELVEESGIRALPHQLREIDTQRDTTHKTFVLALPKKPTVILSREHDKYMWWTPNQPLPHPIRIQVQEKLQ